MSQYEPPQKMLNRCAGQNAQQWREALQLSQSDMAEVLAHASQSPIEAQMIADWESGKDELPGYLFCFIERFHQSAIAQFSNLEAGTVMQQKESLVSKVHEEMRQYLDDKK